MKRTVVKFFLYGLMLSAGFLLFEIFYPRTYNVPPQQKRAGTKFWNLSTGSTMGYTLITANANKKPYPVIYLHGGPGAHTTDLDSQMLSPLAKDGYDVYLYDQVGSGQSNRLKDINEYTVARHIKDLKEIIKNTGAGKVILIGQSWGAILAALFAADDPVPVDKIIFTSPGPIYPVKQELVGIRPPDSFHLRSPYFTNAQGNEAASNIRTKAMEYFATRFGKKLATDKEADDFATYLCYLVNRSVVCDTAAIPKEEAGNGFYVQVMTYHNLLKMQDQRSKIKQLKIPVLVMKGQCDNQRWGFTNEYLELFQNHQLAVIPGAGHFIAVEQPQFYISAIQHFLDQ